MAGCAKSASQGILQEFHGGLGPAMIFIQTKLFAFPAVHDAIFAIQVSGLERTDKERCVNWRLRGGEGGGGRMSELVILYRLDAAAAGNSGCEGRSCGG